MATETENIKDLKNWIDYSGAEPKVKEVYELLKQFMEAPEREEWLKQRKLNWDAVGKNIMWTADEEKELALTGQLPIVANECNKGVQASTAIATDNKPNINFLPRKGGSLYLSELCKRGHDLVWEQNRGQILLHQAVWECKTSGLTGMDSFFDRNKGIFGQARMDCLKPTGIYFDPNSTKSDYSDSDIIKAYPRTKKYIRDKYGKKITDDDMSFGRDMIVKSEEEGEKSTGLTSGDSYTMEDGKRDENTGEKQPKNIWEIEALLLRTRDEFIVTVTFAEGEPKTFRLRGSEEKEAKERINELYAEQGIVDVEMFQTKVVVRDQIIIVGKKIIEENENPYGEDPDGDPIQKINLLGHSLTDSAYPTCPTTFALPLNREKNKRKSQHVYATSIMNNPVIVEPANSTKWEGKPGTAGSRVMVDKNAGFPPQYLLGGVNTQDFMSYDIQLSKDIQDQYDTPDVVLGRAPVNRKDSSGKAIAYLQDLAGVMSKPFISKLEEFLERIGRANLAIMLQNWKRHQWEALLDEKDWEEWVPEDEKAAIEAQGMPQIGPDGMPMPQDQMQPQKPKGPSGEEIRARWMEAIDLLAPIEGEPNIDIMDFHIKVQAGSSMPTNRMAKQAEALEQVREGLLDPETYWEQTDSTLKDKVVPRLKTMNAMLAQQGAMGKKKK